MTMATLLRTLRQSNNRNNDTNSLLERASSDSSFSRHSSIQGPYRGEQMEDTSFPVYCTVKSQSQIPKIYSRSILSLGRGLGPHFIKGADERRPELHLRQGACIGDVGYLDENGSFFYCFNIFQPADHPIQRNMTPENFSPAFPPLSTEEIRVISNHFPAATILTSEGVEVTKKSESPLDVQFSTSSREGAVLILPNGTTREELVDSSRIYQYIKDHATSWYQRLNGSEDECIESPIPNGTLWVVSGVDRTDSYRMAAFPYGSGLTKSTSKTTQFRYNGSSSTSPWQGDSNLRPMHYRSGNYSDGTQGAVLLSVLAVALSPEEWRQHVAYIPPRSVTNCPVLPPVVSGLRSWVENALDRIIKTTKPPSVNKPKGFFHPSIILLHILLLTDSSATVGIVPDSVWSSKVNGHLLTHNEVVELVIRVIDDCDIVNTDGVITFSPKLSSKAENKDATRSRIMPWFSKPRKHNADTSTNIHQNMRKVLWIPE
ncbi:hypothetical protein BJ912DRAFT_645648 [Pholiota molesta]|nr:hypothetical protein BJ912DRAFT_645648 [Pholiota molesta]